MFYNPEPENPMMDQTDDLEQPIDMNTALKNHEEIYFLDGQENGQASVIQAEGDVKPTSIEGVFVVGEETAQPPSETDSQLCEIDNDLDSNDSHSGENNIFTNYRMLRIPGDDEDEEEEDEEGGVKFMCPETGAHFEFSDMTGRLNRLGQVWEQLDAAVEEERLFMLENER